MPSFKVPCPSCENQVLITDPNAIGTKVECPKCKYRFKAEAPAGGVPKDEGKGAKGKGKEKDKKTTAPATADGKKKSKKLVAIVVGVVAVGLLAVVGFSMMGGDNKPKGGAPGGGGGGGGLAQVGGTGDGTGDGTETENKDKKDKESEKKVNPGPGKKVYPRSDKDENATTNLLPNETVSLYRFDPDKVRQTPLGLLVDGVTLEMFRASFGFDFNDVATYYHAFVGESRDPFGVMRLKAPAVDSDVIPRNLLAGAPEEIKKRKLFTFRTNPFINGVTNAFAFHSLFAEYFETAPAAPAKPAESRKVGVCVYDSQHVLVGDVALLRKFLNDLDERGYPRFAPGTADKPMYLSLDPKLKRALQEVGSESGAPSAIVYAERLVPGLYDPKLLKTDLQPVAAVLEPVLNRTRFLAASLNKFDSKGLILNARLSMEDESTAVDVSKQHLIPALTTGSWTMSFFLNTYVEFRNLTSGGMPIFPGMGMIPPGPGGVVPPGPGGVVPPGPGGRPIGPPPPPPAGGQFQPERGGFQPPGPGGFQPPGPGGFQPPGPGGFQPGFEPDPTQLPPSHIDLGLTDHIITLTVELYWSDDIYRRLIAPRLIGHTSTIKGKMAVFASDLSYHALSAAVPRMLAATKEFPRGTADRKLTDVSRMGLKYRPDHRVSFFVELLPYISPARNALTVGVNPDLAWFDEKNLHSAEGWVPELLVPTYPQSAWRAITPYVTSGRVMGGTNYVGIAGVGLDAARYDPTNPAHAKKVGIAGYEWGSKVEEVTDGLDKTIYLMQTPPGLQQPWIAGGGATLRGLSETDPMQGFRHTYGTPDGKPGTFALMGDGSVRFIPGDIQKDKLLAMATRAGGEDLSDIDKHAPLISSPGKKSKDAELKAEPKAEASKPTDSPTKESKPTTKPADAPAPKEK